MSDLARQLVFKDAIVLHPGDKTLTPFYLGVLFRVITLQHQILTPFLVGCDFSGDVILSPDSKQVSSRVLSFGQHPG